ncbi:hypothetical protein SC206_16290 [Rouxiella sp. T17]|uniref:hypothetical protein n=1 Tax=Rouxiella sp. T17 TaxID=3085684 RepID=UPI002FC688DD
MKLTLDMIALGLALYENPEGFFLYLKNELENQSQSPPYQKVTIENVVNDMNMAIDFFMKDRVIAKTIENSPKRRIEIEAIIDEIENYNFPQACGSIH